MFSFFKKTPFKKTPERGCTEGMTEKDKKSMFFSLSGFATTDINFFEEQYRDLTPLEQSEFTNYVTSDEFSSKKELIAVATYLKKLLEK